MKNTNAKKLKGFSLIEMIIAIAVFSIIVLATVSAFASVVKVRKNSRQAQNNLEMARSTVDSMVKIMRMSSLLKTPDGNLESNQIFMYNNSQKKCVSYRFSGTDLEVAEFFPDPDSPEDCNQSGNYTDWQILVLGGTGSFQVTQTSEETPRAIGKASVALKVGNDNYGTSVSFRDYQNILRMFGGSGGGDDEYTKLLLHMDDESLTDNSTGHSEVHTVGLNGNVARSSTQSEFGGYSASFDGSGDYLEIADSDDWDFGTGDATIDLWYNPSDAGDRYTIAGKINGGNDNSWYIDVKGGTIYFGFGTVAKTASGLTVNPGSWYHIAIVRNETSVKFYFNGTYVEGGATTGSVGASTDHVRIGAYSSSAAMFNGYIDEVRISKGIARTEDENDSMYDPENNGFTPPISAYGGGSSEGYKEL